MHTKGRIREFFENLVEEGFFQREGLTLEDVAGVSDDNDRVVLTVGRLFGMLWRSTDIMPSHLRAQLREDRDWGKEPYTYAQAVQRLHTELKD